ncbi:MAG: glycosyltransferase [Paludibacter sp.]|nr:glycosyltransferase [Paludibacter sp.]
MEKTKLNSLAIVIVLYNTNLDNCISYKTLSDSIKNTHLNWDLILFNNSPDFHIVSDVAKIVINSPKNEMLSGAYNFAYRFAIENNRSWLLLLDQDTEITIDYFNNLSNVLNNGILPIETVAVIPFLKENNKIISPHRISFFNLVRSPIVNPGILGGHITAFNSLSLINVDFLKTIGGFSSNYRLDMLDYWMYLKIYKLKKQIYLMDTCVKHSLSLNNFENSMSIERYKQLLLSENKYISEFNFPHMLFYKTRLVFRSIKQFLVYSNKKYSKITFINIFK